MRVFSQANSNSSIKMLCYLWIGGWQLGRKSNYVGFIQTHDGTWQVPLSSSPALASQKYT